MTPDNAAYALALIAGVDLNGWHQQPAWIAKSKAARTQPVKIFSARQRSVAQMAMRAYSAVASGNGQEVLRTMKNKDSHFSSQWELEKYIEALIESQDGLCAITQLPLQYLGEQDDDELLCSLDRIDSDAHYEAGNLQVVCRFVNRWKNDGKDTEFRRLIELVRAN